MQEDPMRDFIPGLQTLPVAPEPSPRPRHSPGMPLPERGAWQRCPLEAALLLASPWRRRAARWADAKTTSSPRCATHRAFLTPTACRRHCFPGSGLPCVRDSSRPGQLAPPSPRAVSPVSPDRSLPWVLPFLCQTGQSGSLAPLQGCALACRFQSSFEPSPCIANP